MRPTRFTTPRLIIRNSLLSITTNLVYAITGFFLIHFFIVSLGPETYGIWILIGAIFRHRDILTLGLNSAVNRYIPIYNAKNDIDAIYRILSTAFIYHIIITVILILILYAKMKNY